MVCNSVHTHIGSHLYTCALSHLSSTHNKQGVVQETLRDEKAVFHQSSKISNSVNEEKDGRKQ